jgi:hypothetical protein
MLWVLCDPVAVFPHNCGKSETCYDEVLFVEIKAVKCRKGRMAFIAVMAVMMFLRCADDSGSDSTGGREYLLVGSWWVSALGSGEGYYFDGAGRGFDLSLNASSEVYIVCDNPITYSYNGHDLVVLEHGTQRRFTFEFTGDETARVTFMGLAFTAALQNITAHCIE